MADRSRDADDRGTTGQNAPLRRPSHKKPVVSLAEAEQLALRLAEMVSHSPPLPQIVIGIANGGVHPAFHIAEALGVPLRVYRVQRRAAHLKNKLAFARRALSWQFLRPVIYRLNRYADRWFGNATAVSNDVPEDVRGKRVLLVDDCIDSGGSVALVRALLQQRGAAQIEIAAICWTTRFDSVSRHGVTPSHFLARRLECYPWSTDNPDYAEFARWLKEHAPPTA